jgi:short-subunit dehydrogenase
MTKLALVTGASEGIGKSLARYHAKKGGDLIITARHKDSLDATKAEIEEEFGVKVHVITSDLSQVDGAQKLYDEVKKQQLEIDYLINNAGFGGQGSILERKLEDDVNMIMVNVVAYVTLTHLFAKEMADRRGGKILSVGSIAGFMPGPNQAVYYASKAFINSFSQAVNQELKSKGVTATVVCPGLVDTALISKAGLDQTKVTMVGTSTAESVARIGYDAMIAEKLVTFDEYRTLFLFEYVVPFLPRRLVLALAQYMQAKST